MNFDVDARRFYSGRADYPREYRYILHAGLSVFFLKKNDIKGFLLLQKNMISVSVFEDVLHILMTKTTWRHKKPSAQ